VITDLVLGLFSHLAGWLVDTLPPAGAVAFPGVSAIATTVAKLDSLVPVAGVIQVAVGVLAAVLVFFLVRLVLMLRYVLLP
jgi:hypothetical protein